jgi:dihydroorotate dehydrogenase
MDLTTHYMGLQLKNPLVASASPLSADLGSIRYLEDSGAAAIVLPSIFEEQIEASMLRETLTAVGLENSPEARGYLPESNRPQPQQYLDLIRRAVEAVDIPIIGSLNGTTEEGWISYAKMIQEAGATSLELNVYFIPTDISLTGRDVEQRYLEILRAVRKGVDIPIAIKLSPYFSSMGQVRHLPHVMTEANQLASQIVCRHTSFDADQTPRHIREHGPNPAATKPLTQNNCPLVIQADQMQVFLPVSMPMVLTTTASVPCDMAMCSPCFEAPIEIR